MITRTEVIVFMATFTAGLIATEPRREPRRPCERVVRMASAKARPTTNQEVRYASHR